MSLIKLAHLSKIYDSSCQTVMALKAVDLVIDNNELVAIVGSSGSGKSTLLNILGLLDRPSSGQYFLQDQEVSKLSDDQLSSLRNYKIGFVFQAFFLIAKLTAMQNVMLPLLYRNIATTLAHRQAKAILNKFGILHLSHHRPYQLSGGQQQRVALARALIGNPNIILADEPTGALDSHTSQEVMNELIRLHYREKKTIIIVTHDPLVASQCQRLVKIKDGAIISDSRQCGV